MEENPVVLNEELCEKEKRKKKKRWWCNGEHVCVECDDR